MRRRIYYKNAVTHCYQRTIDNGVLFYTYSDYLVYFTHYCMMARKHHIKVLALCQMPDHVHDSVIFDSEDGLLRFKSETNATFARRYNEWYHRSGALFEGPFGFAHKLDDKRIRSNLIYVANNPVERKLVAQAESYRWNYLAYAVSDHPFSEKLIVRNARWALRKALREVKVLCEAGKPLTHACLLRMSQPLDKAEIQQLTDHIISCYNVIDYQMAFSRFNGHAGMLAAAHATTGSEYDIRERFVGKTDAYYARMTAVLLQTGRCALRDLFTMSSEMKHELFLLLMRETGAPPRQIAKFLHMSLRKA